MRVTFALAVIVALSCRGDADPWHYPVRLGISRDSARALLGLPSSAYEALNVESFVTSGVSLMYDSTHRVVEITLAGSGGAEVVLGGDEAWLPSRSAIIEGVTPSSTVREVSRRLGEPVDTNANSGWPGQTKFRWRRFGYSFAALAWSRDTTVKERPRQQGALTVIWLSRAIE